MSTPIPERIEPGHLWLCSNAAWVSLVRNNIKAESGDQAWPSPDIMTLDAWLQDRWRALEDTAPKILADRVLAGPEQEYALWRGVMEDMGEHSGISAAALADHAMGGWNHLLLEGLPLAALKEEELRLTREYRLQHPFHPWVAEFEKRLAAAKLISWPQALALLCSRQQRQWQCIHLLGFVQKPGALQLKLLQCAAADLTHEKPQRRHKPAYRVHAEPDCELGAALDWALPLHKEHPGQRIAIVLGDDERGNLEPCRRICRQRLRAWGLADDVLCLHPFDRLADAPLAQAALLLLDINRAELDWQQALALIRSRCWGRFDREYGLRAAAETALRQSRRRQLGAAFLAGMMDRCESAAGLGDGLSGRLYNCIGMARKIGGKAPPSTWAKLFESQLTRLGWPGPHPGDGAQAAQAGHSMEAFWQCLLGLASLDQVLPSCTINRALDMLRRGCARQRQRQDGNRHAAINIIDTLEGAVGYDHIYVCGMHRDAWPRATSPHPLVPLALQKRTLYPRSDSDAERLFCRALLGNLDARTIVFSWHSGAAESGPSPLLAHHNPQPLQPPRPPPGQPPPCATEQIAAGDAPPLAGHERRGDASLVRTLVQCPLVAFFTRRLGAVEQMLPRDGICAMERGTAIHRALEHFWRRCKGHAALTRLTQSERSERVEQAVQEALEQLDKRRADYHQESLHPLVRELESEQMYDRLMLWLELEAERHPFAVVATEQDQQLSLGGIELRLRIDRLDKQISGADCHLLIDYKTGRNCNPALWHPPLPAEPQLPLYLVAMQDAGVQVGAMIFAQLTASEAAMHCWYNARVPQAMRHKQQGGRKPREDWRSAADWHEPLENLLRDYAQGRLSSAVASHARHGLAPWEPLLRNAAQPHSGGPGHEGPQDDRRREGQNATA